MAKSKSIITVVGKDQVGIIARVTGYLYENNVNVEDITQSIVAGFFNMMMIADFSSCEKDFGQVVDELEKMGEEMSCIIKAQREEIFDKMHRI